MRTFRPDEAELEATTDAPQGFGPATGPGAPVTRSGAYLEARDGGLRSGVWESGPGTADYAFGTDEWAYILDGEAHVTAAGATHVLRAGDVFYTPAGERMSWTVPHFVRKVWVHRRPPLVDRIRSKLARMR